MREHVLALLRRHLPAALRPSGQSNVVTKCPFHKGGEERKPSFSINVDLGVFNCFTCHETGTIRTLLKKLELPRSQIDAELSIIQPALERQAQNYKLEKQHFFVNEDPFRADYTLPESLLGVYDWCPTTLVDKGFDAAVLKQMDVGYDKANNRIMFPIRDMYGNLSGFSGGITPWTNNHLSQKYRVYEGRRRGFDGKWLPSDFGEWFDEKHPDYHFENHDFLWNYDEVFAKAMAVSDPKFRVYIVEGFKACLWMIQNGFKSTVALMGSYISDRQQKMIHRLGCTVVLCLDNDEAGRRATLNVGDLLWRPLHGRLLVMPYYEDVLDDSQPDDYEPWALKEMESLSKPYLDYINSRRRGNNW